MERYACACLLHAFACTGRRARHRQQRLCKSHQLPDLPEQGLRLGSARLLNLLDLLDALDLLGLVEL